MERDRASGTFYISLLESVELHLGVYGSMASLDSRKMEGQKAKQESIRARKQEDTKPEETSEGRRKQEQDPHHLSRRHRAGIRRLPFF